MLQILLNWVLQKHLTWYNYYPPEGHVPHYKFIIIYYTTPPGPHLVRHIVPHQDFIHSRGLGNKLTHLTNIRGTHEGGGWPPTPQCLPKVKPHPHALHYQRVVVAPACWTGRLCHLARGNWTGSGDVQQNHDLCLRLRQTQAQEAQHRLYTHTHLTGSHVELLKDSLGSGPLRERPIPKLSQLLHNIHWN